MLPQYANKTVTQPSHKVAQMTARPFLFTAALAIFLAAQWLMSGSSLGQPLPDPVRLPDSLKKVPVPMPSNWQAYIADPGAAIRLGKAFYWEMQVGSDGIQACASCHFSAGADRRVKNQLNPKGSMTFDTAGPNHLLKLLSDFPRVNDDVTSSQGVFRTNFIDIVPGSPVDRCTVLPDPVFQVGGINVRRVPGRNTPSAINAVFYFRNFWDGRAQNHFNGVNPFGLRDPDAKIFRVQGDGTVLPIAIPPEDLNNASPASQAVGPPLSDFEMSCAGRTFPKLGKKLLSLRPLARQIVHPEDSVLGPIASSRGNPNARGLSISYSDLIKAAFWPEFWQSSKIVKFINGHPVITDAPGRPLTTDEYTVMEANFSLFWGLAIQFYEATLVADDSPFDRFMDDPVGNANVLTEKQKQGLTVFIGNGRCINCHSGAELTNASVTNVQNERLELMIMGDGGQATYDNGFYNIGARPTGDDPGVGGTDPFGNPLSETRLAQSGQIDLIGSGFDVTREPIPAPGDRVAVDGAFKAPGLRNVELTAPFFHNGGMATLRQVVDFYQGAGEYSLVNQDNLDPDILDLRLTAEEKGALVAFLKALTDERVRHERMPFDHPELFVPNGHPRDELSVTNDGTGNARDAFLQIPAVGAGGGPSFTPFEELLILGESAGATIPGTETISVTGAFYFRSAKRWVISGRSTVPGPGNSMTLHLGPDLTGPVLGTVPVDSAGNWRFDRSNSPTGPDATNKISIESSNGATLLGVSVNLR